MFQPEFEEDSPFGIDPKFDLRYLLQKSEQYLEDYDEELITNAFWYCYEKHKNMMRKSGKPFYTHPLNVSIVLLEEFPIYDSQTVAACLLHDTIEDVDGVTWKVIKDKFGAEVARMVNGVTKISHKEVSQTENKAASYRKLFLALVRDIRVILIKLADRLHNVRTLHYLPLNKQKYIAEETLNFYTMLAHRLGLIKIKIELENLSFYYLDRESYEDLRVRLSEKRKEFIGYITSFLSIIEANLLKHDIEHTLTIYHKHEYEIFNMIQEGKALSDIDNFYSINLIINSNEISDCYRAHGIIANTFDSIKFLDYISKPKFDWYKSLNTEIIGPDGKKIELSIRTKEMEEIAEDGFASKFSLKNKRKALNITKEDTEEWGEWMQEMIEEYPDNAIQIIWNSIKVNLFDVDVVVYNKKGEAVHLPDGSTVLDFAFAKSYEDGMHCISAKINGVIKVLSYELKYGDQVEIITSENVMPEPKWQQYVVTFKAVISLFHYFKENPFVEISTNKDVHSYVKMKIVGEDREGMLKQITEAIGKNSMHELHISAQEEDFEGVFTLKIVEQDDINNIFLKILNIQGIKSVNLIEED